MLRPPTRRRTDVSRRPLRARLNWPHVIGWGSIQAGVVLAPFVFTWSGLAIAAALYFAAGLGITMGYHRLLTHRSFRTPLAVEYLLTLLGSLAIQGGPIQWVA